MRPPEFWHHNYGPASAPLARALLTPLSWVVSAAGRWRHRATKPMRAEMPVLCVGNVSMGGTGKTPLCIALASVLNDSGYRPSFLTRGYGGKMRGPVAVDLAVHTARDVGDEALLLARFAPTMVARDRRAGAAALAALDVNVIIMDDGFQNPHLHKDFCFLVHGNTGNGKVFPAGPLREPLKHALRRADAVIVFGDMAAPKDLQIPTLSALMHNPTPPPEGPLIAFAGIGQPEKFFAALRATNAALVQEISFNDHHVYSASEIADLRTWAQGENAQLITTQKDLVRLPEAWREGIIGWPVEARFADRKAVMQLLAPVLEKPPFRKNDLA